MLPPAAAAERGILLQAAASESLEETRGETSGSACLFRKQRISGSARESLRSMEMVVVVGTGTGASFCAVLQVVLISFSFPFLSICCCSCLLLCLVCLLRN